MQTLTKNISSAGQATILTFRNSTLLPFPSAIQCNFFTSTTNHKSCDNCSTDAERSQTPNHAKYKQPSFGVVAALTKNGIIGINNTLPWKHNPIPQDRTHFLNLTRNKILVVGRKTFAEEDPTGGHIDHVRCCIVVSRTMAAPNLFLDGWDGTRSTNGPELKIARSFEEALHLAYSLTNTKPESDDVAKITNRDQNETHGDEIDTQQIDCWIAGGEGIYKEALIHPCASEVHLTHVDMTIDIDEYNTKKDKDCGHHIAHFPLEDLKRNGFNEISRSVDGVCTFCMYRKHNKDGFTDA